MSKISHFKSTIGRPLLGIGVIASVISPSFLVSCGTPKKSFMNIYNWAELKAHLESTNIKGFGILNAKPKEGYQIVPGADEAIGLENAKWKTSINYERFYVLEINGKAREELIGYLKTHEIDDYYNQWFNKWRAKYFLKGETDKYYQSLKGSEIYDLFEFDGVVVYVEFAKKFFNFKGWID